jgi:hypothetical protein
MPYKDNIPNVRNKKLTKEKEKKYTLVITNIPKGYFNTFVHWEDIQGGKFMSDYYTTDEVLQVIHSIPIPIQQMCIVKVYRCSINSIVDEIDGELEIKIE